MKLRNLAPAVVLALTTVAAHSQTNQGNFGLYLNPVAVRVSNSVKDTGPFAFLGPNSTSKVFVGFDLGGFYDFYHSNALDTGLDIRFADSHADNAMLRTFNVGLRVAGHPFSRPIKPYAVASFGFGTSKAPNSTVRVRKVDYDIFGGVDYTLARHVDFRAIEIGYGALTTVSSATVGAGGNIAIPSSKLVSFSSGFVFRF